MIERHNNDDCAAKSVNRLDASGARVFFRLAQPDIVYSCQLERTISLRRRLPALANLGHEFDFVLFDEPDQCLIADIFMCR